MNVTFDEMSITEIYLLIGDAENAISQKKEAEKSQVLEEMKALAKDRGFEFSEFMSGKKPRKKAAVKYRNPENYEQTWTGMGRKPKWLVEVLEGEESLENFKI
jgi:DNA-binding protein H-NS